ncbi:carbohydrate-binding protein [Flavobacterium aquiphilum]|uniref:carbohydrate-binding protein n=1 Tax=Flavobacterium aquiphilum TaxID=3003261 RepID=UPI0024815BD9|nr:carbohydrate-binding protein [Flavobacterium aquiphilum]
MNYKLIVLGILISFHLSAKEIHVSGVNGNDNANGSQRHPLKTINAAAQKAMPGDVIIVHAGIYREWVKPLRGGTDNKHRITYVAAKGEKVVITGSEAPKGWQNVSGNVWKLTLPNAYFKDSNPFGELIYGDWYRSNGKNIHTGAVYLDNRRLPEVFSRNEILARDNNKPSWYAEADDNGGSVLMNIDMYAPFLTDPKQVAVEKGDVIYNNWKHFIFTYLTDGSILHLTSVDFGAGTDTVEYKVATQAKSGKIEFHLDKPDGELVGTTTVTNTGNWGKYEVFKTTLSRKISGKHDIHVVLRAPGSKPEGTTTIWACLPGMKNPDSSDVEIAVRSTVFFPKKTGINYITVKGFTLQNAATNWAPPSAFQPGIIGPHWASHWIIEDNEILNSRCSGISLGRPTYGHAHHPQNQQPEGRIYPEVNGGQTAEQLHEFFEFATWTKEEAGFHIVLNNHIHDCGQAGIVGCSGGAFSVIERNDIHDITQNEPFNGEEMAGIKLHFAVDAIIRDNRIFNTTLALWLDWGAQGTQVLGNLMYKNSYRDILVEVSHGPTLVANNIALSTIFMRSMSQGLAIVHNLALGNFEGFADEIMGGRKTFFYIPHSTSSAGKVTNPGGDWRWYNNLLPDILNPEGKNHGLPVAVSGNVVFTTKDDLAVSNNNDNLLKIPGFLKPKFVERKDGIYLILSENESWRNTNPRKLVTTELLGKAVAPQQEFKNPDGSALRIDTDYFGKKRNIANPFPGPFETPVNGEVKVWPK